MNELLTQIYATLCKVEVHGKDNLDKLLGCIQALEQIITENSTETEEN